MTDVGLRIAGRSGSAHPGGGRGGDQHVLDQPELQFPAFLRVNPADEVIPEEVNLSGRPRLYTCVCTSSLSGGGVKSGGASSTLGDVGGQEENTTGGDEKKKSWMQ